MLSWESLQWQSDLQDDENHTDVDPQHHASADDEEACWMLGERNETKAAPLFRLRLGPYALLLLHCKGVPRDDRKM